MPQSKQQQSDAFEALRPNQTEIKEAQAKIREQTITRASRYHRVFGQNADGIAIMEEWTNRFMFSPPADPGMTHFECGIIEGKRQVMREIIDQLNIIASYNNE